MTVLIFHGKEVMADGKIRIMFSGRLGVEFFFIVSGYLMAEMCIRDRIYNVANENTYCSIMDMARLMARVQNLSVEVYLDNIEKYGYAKTLYMNLDTTKVQKLGWHPQIGLSTMIERLITVVKDKDN